jgi:hypothetical protein
VTRSTRDLAKHPPSRSRQISRVELGQANQFVTQHMARVEALEELDMRAPLSAGRNLRELFA